MHSVAAPGVRRSTAAVPFRALNAMGYFAASMSKLHFAMGVFFSKSPLKPAADFEEKFWPLARV